MATHVGLIPISLDALSITTRDSPFVKGSARFLAVWTYSNAITPEFLNFLTALDTSGVEAGWLRDLLMDLPLVDKPVPAILMNCDNQTVITKVKSSKDNMKSNKHIRMRLKAVRKL